MNTSDELDNIKKFVNMNMRELCGDLSARGRCEYDNTPIFNELVEKINSIDSSSAKYRLAESLIRNEAVRLIHIFGDPEAL